MRNRRMKKAAVMMAVICVLSLTGCGGKGENEEAESGPRREEPGMAYEGQNMELSGVEGEILYYAVRGEKMYVMTGNMGNTYRIYCADMDGENVQCVASDLSEAGVGAFCADDTGNMVYVAEHADGERTGYELVRLNAQGKELYRSDISRCIKSVYGTGNIGKEAGDGVETGNGISMEIDGLAGIVAKADGSVVLGSGESVYFFDEKLSQADEVKMPSDIVMDIALAKNGDIVCVTDEPGSDMINYKTYLLNADSRAFGDTLNIKIGGTAGQDVVMDGEEYDFYYISREGISGYTIETGETVLLMSAVKSYTRFSDLMEMQAGTNQAFISMTKEYDQGVRHNRLVVWRETDPEADKDKEIITLGVPYLSFMPGEVARFNRSHSDCKIEVVDFSEMDEERMLADIMAGKMPDIIDLHWFPLSVQQCAAKGLIEELTPYYEKDAEYKTEDMVPSVYEAEMQDGGLYYIAPTFSVITMVGRVEDVGDGDGWTVSDLRALMERKGENAQLLKDKEVRLSYLDVFLENTISDYVDWENGVCHFDSEDFRYLLELSKAQGTKKEEEMSDAEIMESVDTMYSRFRDKEYLLIEENELSPHMIQIVRETSGVPVNYIGYPNQAGEGSYFSFGSMYAISSRSEHKELAWEFVRSMLSKESQKVNDEIDSIMPVMQDSFEAHMRALTATEVYVDELGELVEPVEEYDFSWGDYNARFGVPSDEDVQLFLDIIGNTKHVVSQDSMVLGIVYEEAQDYFNGRQRLDKTVDAIQSRVTTYVNEQKQ